MDFFVYIADSDPAAAAAVLAKWGYATPPEVEYTDQLGDCLRQLVANEGEKAVRDLANIHPDKDLILESFPTNNGIASTEGGCKDCKEKKATTALIEQAGGGSTANWLAQNQGTLVVVAALALITLAIVSKK